MSITETKKALRKKMLQERAQLDASFKVAYDNWICEQLKEIFTTNIIHQTICPIQYQTLHSGLHLPR